MLVDLLVDFVVGVVFVSVFCLNFLWVVWFPVCLLFVCLRGGF